MTIPANWRDEIQQRLADAVSGIDHREPERVLKYCAEDFCLTTFTLTDIMGPEVTKEQFAYAMKRRAEQPAESRHCIWNLRLLSGDETSVEVAYIMCAFRLEEDAIDPVPHVTDVVDRWRLEADGEWRVVRRVVTRAFEQRTASV